MTPTELATFYDNAAENLCTAMGINVKAADNNLAEVELSDATEIDKDVQTLFPGLTSAKAIAFKAVTGSWVVKIESGSAFGDQQQAHVSGTRIVAWSDLACFAIGSGDTLRFCKEGPAQNTGKIQIRIMR